MFKLVTLHDFFESIDKDNKIADEAKMVLTRAGREELPKIMCIRDEFARYIRMKIQLDEEKMANRCFGEEVLLGVDSLGLHHAMELIVHRVNSDCHQCLNEQCRFRRRSNLEVPSTVQDEYYSPPAEIIHYQVRPDLSVN